MNLKCAQISYQPQIGESVQRHHGMVLAARSADEADYGSIIRSQRAKLLRASRISDFL